MSPEPFLLRLDDRYVILIFMFHPPPQHILEGCAVSIALMPVICTEGVCIMYNTYYILFLILCLCTYHDICDPMQGGGMCLKTDEFRVLRMLYTTLQSRNMCNYLTHSATFE